MYKNTDYKMKKNIDYKMKKIQITVRTKFLFTLLEVYQPPLPCKISSIKMKTIFRSYSPLGLRMPDGSSKLPTGGLNSTLYSVQFTVYGRVSSMEGGSGDILNKGGLGTL